MGSEIPAIQSLSPEFLSSLLFPSVLTVIVIFGILAFFGYRLFRYFLVISGAVLSGVVGYSVISPLFLGLLGTSGMAALLLPTVSGFVCALIGGLLVNRFMRASTFLFVACVGFYLAEQLALYLGSLTDVLSFLATPTGAAIFSTVIGIALGYAALPYFKILYIFLTSVAGLGYAGYLVADRLHQEGAGTYLYSLLIILGVCIGVYAFIFQLRTNRKSSTPGEPEEDGEEPTESTEPSEHDGEKQPRRRLFSKKSTGGATDKKKAPRAKRSRRPLPSIGKQQKRERAPRKEKKAPKKQKVRAEKPKKEKKKKAKKSKSQ